MANFLLIIDPDRERRERLLARASREIAFLPHLSRGCAVGDDFDLTWAAAPGAPISQCQTTGGRFAHIFGEPLDERGTPFDATALATSLQRDFRVPAQGNGFYAGLCRDPQRGWRIEADVLGVFPIYYWQDGDVLLVGSSPALFRLHPRYSSRLDLHGLAALLLTSGLVDGRTIEAGVRRLAPDHLLYRTPTGHIHEISPPKVSVPTTTSSSDACIDEVAALHRRFLRGGLARATGTPAMLLSGGLDSRLLAGFVTQLGHRPHCLTFGKPHDLDAQCATGVAAALGLPQTIHDISPSDYLRYADDSVRWERLSGGLYAIPIGWNLTSSGRPVADRIVCGLTLDAVIGGPKDVARSADGLTFEQLRVSSLGFSRDEIDALVCDRPLRQACEDIRERLVDTYLRAAEQDYLRTWRNNLISRQRFPVGACAWRYSLYAWPVLPALDRQLLRLAESLPYEAVAGRRIQHTMLARHFPALAALDLDRNYYDPVPSAATTPSRWRHLQRRVKKIGRRVEAWLGRDPRFYMRVMNFNSPGWRSVRAGAEEGQRRDLRGLFDLEALARVLPGPRATACRRTDPIAHSTPLKNVVGLMHWMNKHA